MVYNFLFKARHRSGDEVIAAFNVKNESCNCVSTRISELYDSLFHSLMRLMSVI